jgi:hypothetical protein
MRSCGETMTDRLLVEKVLRSFTPQFDHIGMAIEESSDLAKMMSKEMQGSA